METPSALAVVLTRAGFSPLAQWFKTLFPRSGLCRLYRSPAQWWGTDIFPPPPERVPVDEGATVNTCASMFRCRPGGSPSSKTRARANTGDRAAAAPVRGNSVRPETPRRPLPVSRRSPSCWFSSGGGTVTKGGGSRGPPHNRTPWDAKRPPRSLGLRNFPFCFNPKNPHHMYFGCQEGFYLVGEWSAESPAFYILGAFSSSRGKNECNRSRRFIGDDARVADGEHGGRERPVGGRRGDSTPSEDGPPARVARWRMGGGPRRVGRGGGRVLPAPGPAVPPS